MNQAVRTRLSPARSGCGGLRVRIAGEACVLRASGALWAVDQSTLIAADLHLEKGSSFAARGQMLPPYDSAATLDRLEAEIEALSPRRVILLGDSFHDAASVGRMAAEDRIRVDRLSRARDWVWLEGNHDREGLAGLNGDIVEEISVGTLRLTHEPAPDGPAGEVAGHLHPAARVARYGRGVRRPCFVTDGRRVVLPAFGAFTGGLDVRHPVIAALFPDPPLCVALGKGRVHALAWETVG